MSYQNNTEMAQAARRARRDMIIAATIDVIKKSGMAGALSPAIRKRGRFSIGLIFKEFPDVAELRAATIATLLQADLAAMREAASRERHAIAALAAAMTVLFNRWDNTRLVRACIDNAVYCAGVRSEMDRLLRPAAPDMAAKERAVAVAGALGALYGLHDVNDGSRSRAREAVYFALKGIGFSQVQATRVTA